MQYEYKMIQMPSTVEVEREHRKHPAARFLETLANEQAAEGWEFHRIDVVGTLTNPGFFAQLFGAQPARVEHTVVTFRRPKPEETETSEVAALLAEEPAAPPQEAAIPLEETGVPIGTPAATETSAGVEVPPGVRRFPPREERAA